MEDAIVRAKVDMKSPNREQNVGRLSEAEESTEVDMLISSCQNAVVMSDSDEHAQQPKRKPLRQRRYPLSFLGQTTCRSLLSTGSGSEAPESVASTRRDDQGMDESSKQPNLF